MYLRSKASQTVRIEAAEFAVDLEAGETIWTESSYKFNTAEVVGLGKKIGFRCEAQWVDEEWPFAQTLFIAE
jgi:uncharacterized SAM-dependent methyltransferase